MSNTIKQKMANTRARRTLCRAGVIDINRLNNITDDELMRIRGCGVATLPAVKDLLHQLKQIINN